MGYLRACDERDFDKELDREAPWRSGRGSFDHHQAFFKEEQKITRTLRRVLHPDQIAAQVTTKAAAIPPPLGLTDPNKHQSQSLS